MQFLIKNVVSKAFKDQKPGTSGLRKKTKHFMQLNYTENFVQAIFNAVLHQNNFVLVVGGDGRHYNSNVILNVILPIAAANGVSKIIIGQNGILSTPAVSHIIRKYSADGGIVLTASHNPGGIDEDFGIKYNIKNGGPAPELITDKIFEQSKLISSYKTTDNFNIDLSKLEESIFENKETGKTFIVQVIDSVVDYLAYMKNIFDFTSLKSMITGSDGMPPVNILANSLNGVMGVYVTHIFCNELGMPEANAENCIPMEDFGGRHPDPNLTYAKDLVLKMQTGEYDIGCAFDGDGDRNMILGKNGFFVSPCDSLAVVADNFSAIKYFRENGCHGFARSMPTSSAVDKVAEFHKLPVYEVPTGWKFFGNLMDADKLSLCGEESFGMGSNHIREKDGMWAVLAWLSIMCEWRQRESRPVSIQEITEQHWRKFGRNFFTRYDYENCTTEQGDQVMAVLDRLIGDSPSLVGSSLSGLGKTFVVRAADNFQYTDPIDKSHSVGQGVRVLFEDGSRLIYRLSGTGSSGSTVRIYIDSYQRDIDLNDTSVINLSSMAALEPLVVIGLDLCQIKAITGRQEPTVIT